MTMDIYQKTQVVNDIDMFATDLISQAKLDFDDLSIGEKHTLMNMLSSLVSSPSIKKETKYFIDDQIADRMTDFASNIINDILDHFQERKRFADKYPDNYDSHAGDN